MSQVRVVDLDWCVTGPHRPKKFTASNTPPYCYECHRHVWLLNGLWMSRERRYVIEEETW